MSTDFPPIEARVDLLEQRIEKLSQDTVSGFRRLLEQQYQAEQRIDGRLAKIEARLALVETTMASKADLAAMETRILNTFNQLLALIGNQPTQEK